LSAELSIKYTPTKYHALEGFSVTAISLEDEKEETKGFIAFIKKIWQKIKEFFSRMWNYIKSIFKRVNIDTKESKESLQKKLQDILRAQEQLIKENQGLKKKTKILKIN